MQQRTPDRRVFSPGHHSGAKVGFDQAADAASPMEGCLNHPVQREWQGVGGWPRCRERLSVLEGEDPARRVFGMRVSLLGP
jgi:hypothetical protein